MKNYVYYWYHHMMSTDEREKIAQAIKNKDYYAFIVLYKKQQNFSLSYKMILGRLRDQKTPETRINSMFLRVLGVSFIACISGAFSVNGAQMVPKSHAGL